MDAMIICKLNILQFLWFLLFGFLHISQANQIHYTFVVKEATYMRLCNSKKILTVNGQFPGPTIFANKGDTVIVDVHNHGHQNITIHWHGVKQPRYPWSDGPEYITQCAIQAGAKFQQKILLSTEEGTLWWHAHSDWSRATVHGPIVIYPKPGTSYPFPKPHDQLPIVLGEWWKNDVQEVLNEFLRTGGDPNASDAFTINGHPGHLYPCSASSMFKLQVRYGKTYMLRMINVAMNNILFFSIANHTLTVIGTDASYTKPHRTTYIAISPGQTIDVLLQANRPPNHRYYMAAKAYNSAPFVGFDNTTTTAILQYYNNIIQRRRPPPYFPDHLPSYNDTLASTSFTGALRSLTNADHPIDVPINVTTKLFFTVSINTVPCDRINRSCQGPNGDRFAASVNNITFDPPRIAILEAYYRGNNGVYGDDFPSFPPLRYNYTAESLPEALERPRKGTEVKVLDYNSTVEIVFQGTNLVAGIDHPMHLHGQSFYVVGWGFGNFDEAKDPTSRYNLVDPPLQNTIAVPKNGWAAVRFKASNPGVWLMHCHLERHISWGMETVFIVKNGPTLESKMLPPPPDMPPC